MAIDWKESPETAIRRTGSSTKHSSVNPWFGTAIGLVGVIAGYIIGIF